MGLSDILSSAYFSDGEQMAEMSARDLRRKLRDNQCTELRQKGSHLQVRCGQCQTTVPVHGGKDIARGTLRSIERSLGMCLGPAWARLEFRADSDATLVEDSRLPIGFEGFSNVVINRPVAPPSREYRELEDLERGDLVTIGGRKPEFLVFRTQGITKYVTVHGTKGRKYYKLHVTSLDPFEVGVFQVLSSDGKLADKPYNKPGRVKKTGTGVVE